MISFLFSCFYADFGSLEAVRIVDCPNVTTDGIQKLFLSPATAHLCVELGSNPYDVCAVQHTCMCVCVCDYMSATRPSPPLRKI